MITWSSNRAQSFSLNRSVLHMNRSLWHTWNMIYVSFTYISCTKKKDLFHIYIWNMEEVSYKREDAHNYRSLLQKSPIPYSFCMEEVSYKREDAHNYRSLLQKSPIPYSFCMEEVSYKRETYLCSMCKRGLSFSYIWYTSLLHMIQVSFAHVT